MAETWSTTPSDVPWDARASRDRFQMRGRIGAGNHGVVFRAWDSQLQREVAVKRFSHFLADDPRAMRRISREVASLAKVSHPNVVMVHDLVHMPDGDGEITPHVVMELVEGTSLKDLLATHGPSLRAAMVARGVLEGLTACHAAGILHLDIKPANVLVTPSGGIKIVDFGIARAASDATATVAGTPHYMAPEQFDGRADERSDQYSVGCLLYEAVTGKPPFAGSMAEQVMAHRHHPRPDPRVLVPSIPGAVAEVIQRAMAIEPDQRFASTTHMVQALDTAVAGGGIDVPHRPVSTFLQPEPATERRAPDLAYEYGQPPQLGPVVTRGLKAKRFLAGLAISTLIAGTLPGIAWAVSASVPQQYWPHFMNLGQGDAWWMVAMVLTMLLLLAKRGRFFAMLSGAPVGQPTSGRLIDASVVRGVSTVFSAAVRGSAPLLLPVYVASVYTVAKAVGVPWRDSVTENWWGFAWVMMPLVCVVLLLRSVTRLRPRVGAVLMCLIYLAGATVAAMSFVAYAYVTG